MRPSNSHQWLPYSELHDLLTDNPVMGIFIAHLSGFKITMETHFGVGVGYAKEDTIREVYPRLQEPPGCRQQHLP